MQRNSITARIRKDMYISLPGNRFSRGTILRLYRLGNQSRPFGRRMCLLLIYYIFTDRQTRVSGTATQFLRPLWNSKHGEGRGRKKYLTVFPLKNRKSANRRMQNILRENAFSHYLCYWNEPSIGLIDQESLLTAPSPRSWIYYYPTII